MPPTICQVDGPVCVMRQAADVVIAPDQDGIRPNTVLHGAEAAVVWNEAVLRAADGRELARDRRDRQNAGR